MWNGGRFGGGHTLRFVVDAELGLEWDVRSAKVIRVVVGSVSLA